MYITNKYDIFFNKNSNVVYLFYAFQLDFGYPRTHRLFVRIKEIAL